MAYLSLQAVQELSTLEASLVQSATAARDQQVDSDGKHAPAKGKSSMNGDPSRNAGATYAPDSLFSTFPLEMAPGSLPSTASCVSDASLLDGKQQEMQAGKSRILAHHPEGVPLASPPFRLLTSGKDCSTVGRSYKQWLTNARTLQSHACSSCRVTADSIKGVEDAAKAAPMLQCTPCNAVHCGSCCATQQNVPSGAHINPFNYSSTPGQAPSVTFLSDVPEVPSQRVNKAQDPVSDVDSIKQRARTPPFPVAPMKAPWSSRSPTAESVGTPESKSPKRTTPLHEYTGTILASGDFIIGTESSFW